MKRLTSLIFGIIFVACACFSVSATAPQKIKNLDPDFAGQLVYFELDGEAINRDELQSLVVQAGSELRIYLAGSRQDSLFFDQNGVPIPTADISVSRLRAGQLSIGEIDDPAVEGARFGFAAKNRVTPSSAPYIEVIFAAEYNSVYSTDFAFDVRLCGAGEELPHTAISLAGVMEANEISVAPPTTQLDVSGCAVVVAEEYIGNMELWLGDGVTLISPLSPEGRYYAKVEVSHQGTDDIVSTYRLQTLGFDDDAEVRIESESTRHVYSESGEYLGTTRELLPLQDTYIVASLR